MLNSNAMFRRLKDVFQRYFLTGFLILVPAVVTIVVIFWLVKWIAKILRFGIIPGLINAYVPFPKEPAILYKLYEFGLGTVDFILGLIITLGLILLTGALAKTIFLKRLMSASEKFFELIPGAGFVYNSTRELLNSILSDRGKKFSRVALIEWPNKDSWVIGLLSGDSGEVFDRATGEKMVNVFIPTTPNPTNGYLLVVPERCIKELEMNVQDAFKIIISGGMTGPSKTK